MPPTSLHGSQSSLPTSPSNSSSAKKISFLDANPSTPPRKTSPAKNSPLNNILAARTRAKSSPVPPNMLLPQSPPPVQSPEKTKTSSASTPARRMSVSITSNGTLSPSVSSQPKKEGRKERLHLIFRMFDKDEDDRLNPEEMKDLLCSVFYGPEMKDILTELESTYKQGISFEEFVQICRDESAAKKEARSKSPSGRRARSVSMHVSAQGQKPNLSPLSEYDDDDSFTEEDLKTVFSGVLDSNDDGVVSLSEFKKVITNLGIQNTFSDEELGLLFDGSKTLSFEQFRKLVTM